MGVSIRELLTRIADYSDIKFEQHTTYPAYQSDSLAMSFWSAKNKTSLAESLGLGSQP